MGAEEQPCARVESGHLSASCPYSKARPAKAHAQLSPLMAVPTRVPDVWRVVMRVRKFGQTWFVSLFGGDIRAEFELTHGDFGAIYSLATLASAVTLVWVGRLIDRVPLLTFSCGVFAGLAVASFGVFQATHVVVVAVAMFGLRLCGQGLMTHIAVTSMARYFDANRGKAISVATLGFPMAESLLPLTVVMVTASLGWRDAWLLWSVAVAGVLLPLSVCFYNARERCGTFRE